MYKITDYSYKQADKLGVTIKVSSNKKKKLDVFDKSGKKIASIGAIGYSDYPTYLELEKKGLVPSGYALKRRKLFRKRHIHRSKKGTTAYYADKILW